MFKMRRHKEKSIHTVATDICFKFDFFFLFKLDSFLNYSLGKKKKKHSAGVTKAVQAIVI